MKGESFRPLFPSFSFLFSPPRHRRGQTFDAVLSQRRGVLLVSFSFSFFFSFLPPFVRYFCSFARVDLRENSILTLPDTFRVRLNRMDLILWKIRSDARYSTPTSNGVAESRMVTDEVSRFDGIEAEKSNESARVERSLSERVKAEARCSKVREIWLF